MTGTKPFLEMEADEQRELLGAELADWIEAELWSSGRAQIFYRRVKILARSIGMRFVDVMEVLRADAEAILADRPHMSRNGAAPASNTL